MATYETKFKLGRKLDRVDAAMASDNQMSALFRYDDKGREKHVSLSVESDAMKAEDVAAVFQLLHERGVLVESECKTWINQPQASVGKFGPTYKWGEADIEDVLRLIKHELPVRAPPGAPTGEAAAPALPRTALLKLDEVERKMGELRAALEGKAG